LQNYQEELQKSIKSKQVTVGVIGLGYVGLPLSLRFSECQVKTLGFDIDPQKVDMINDGKSYIKQYPSERVAACQEYFKATTDFSRVSEVDAIIICVPTPLSKNRDPDLSYITGTMKNILPYLKKGQLLSLESTTFPGTCDEILRPMIEDQNLKVGENFFLAFSPEREDPGRKDFTTSNTPKVCGGTTPNCLEVSSMLYETIIEKVVRVSSTQAAELTKLLENIHRAVNVGLVNEMKIIADKMNIDIFEVINAAATKPFGFVPYFPGPGLGGHCIPIDPFYLTWKSREYGVNTRFIELAGEVNSAMPKYVVEKTILALNKNKKSLMGSKVLVLGISYKKNVDDTRESPSIEIMSQLQELGAEIQYHDPHVPEFPAKRDYHFDLKSLDLDQKTLSQMDCVILTTNHDCFNLEFIEKHSNIIVDTRGVFPLSEKVTRA
jgi:UDP-N-acetyl-D-glucosamine dehydrogenase